MRLEFNCDLNGVCVKKVVIYTDKDKTMVYVLELREDTLGKSAYIPVAHSIHNKYADAKAKFVGYVVEAAYTNANNTQETDRENLFIRGSLPYKGKQKV